MTTFRLDPLGRTLLNPFFTPVRREIDINQPVMDLDFFRDGVNDFMHGIKDAFTTANSGINAHIDIVEEEKCYKVTMEVPGVDKDDISILVNNEDQLEIKGCKKPVCTTSATPTEGEPKVERKVLYSEIKRGEFVRTINLGSKIDKNNIKAKFSNGELFITIAKLEEEKPQKVSIDID
ncbi:MAG: Hsp20/alpha crystallin family protein [Ignavibacteria bacterium]|jgi:HSP20 family protein|nr:Hsp20/alpha crystallin family protein [Ignavibacteria bacterium]